MAMTLTQLEKYMILEVENLHIKIDSFAEMFQQQFQLLHNTMERVLSRLDRIEELLERHDSRIVHLENSFNKRKP